MVGKKIPSNLVWRLNFLQKLVASLTFNQIQNHLLSHRDLGAGMSGIRKVSSADRRQSFRARLQRALSLSSSESDDTHSPSRSVVGDTLEDGSSFQGGDGCYGAQENGNPSDESDRGDRQEEIMASAHETNLEVPEQTLLPGDSNTVALECMEE